MHTLFKKSLATGLNILFTGTKVLLSGALCVAVFFIFIFMYTSLSPETFLERPGTYGYSIENTLSTEEYPCSEQEMPLAIFSRTRTTHLLLRGRLHAYYPLYSKGGFPNDQPFVLNIVPSIDPNGPFGQKKTIACLPLPPGPLPYAPKDLKWDLLFDEVTEQNIPPVGPPFIASRKVTSLRFWENPALGTLLSFLFFGLGFAGAAYKVFRNPAPTVRPGPLLFLFPALLAILCIPMRFYSPHASILPSEFVTTNIPFPLFFTYPIFVLGYGIFIQFFHTKPKDFWIRTLFFFYAEGFFGFVFVFCLYGIYFWQGGYPFFPLRQL